MRVAWLLVAGCFEIVPPPEPPKPPDPEPVPIKPLEPCTGERTQVTGERTFELLGEMPAAGNDRVVYRRGTQWEVGIVKDIPHTPKNVFDFDKPWDVEVDRDGTVYFRGLWYGNPEQVNNVGDGLYRLDGTRATPLVDSKTDMPGTSVHFDSAGGFSVDQGWVAFWGGRANTTGVFAWHDDKVIAISTGSVRGTGAPSIRGGRIAFQGEEGGARGMYLWTEVDGAKLVMKSRDGQPFGSVALGDRVLYVNNIYGQKITAWSDGNEWVAAQPDWFKGPIGDAPVFGDGPYVAGDDLLVRVGQDVRSELWRVSGCTLERVAGTGDVVGTTKIRSLYNLRDARLLPDGDLGFVAVMADGTTRLVRAHHK